MNRRMLVPAIAVAALLALLAYFYGGHSAPTGQDQLVTLNDRNLDELKAEFNAGSDKPRLIVMLSPT